MDKFELILICFFCLFAGALLTSLLYQDGACFCGDGDYVQAMRNCIASQDFNSPWCNAEFMK